MKTTVSVGWWGRVCGGRGRGAEGGKKMKHMSTYKSPSKGGGKGYDGVEEEAEANCKPKINRLATSLIQRPEQTGGTSSVSLITV